MVKNLSWTIIGNFFFSFVKWLILIMFIHFLTSKNVGEYSLALAFTAPFFLFANMRLRTLYVVNNNNNYKEFIIIRLIIMIISMAVISIISSLIFAEYLHIFVLVSIIKASELFSDLLYALPHKKNRLDLVGKLLFYKGWGVLLVVSLALLFSDSLFVILIFYSIFSVLYIIIEYRFCATYFEIEKFRFSFFKTILISAIPLGFVQFLSSINTSLPKYFIEIFHEIELVGIFTSITYILVISNLLMSSISQTYMLSIKNLIEQNNYSKLKDLIYKKLSIIGVFIGVASVILTIIFGEIFLKFIYGDTIADYKNILILLSLGISFTFFSWISDTVLMASEYYRIQPLIAILVFVFSLPTAILLVYNFELIGATFTLLFINLFQAVLKYTFSLKIIKRKEVEYENRFLS